MVFLKLFKSFATRNVPNFLVAYDSIQGYNPILDTQGVFVKYSAYNVKIKKEYLGKVNPEEDISNLLKLQHIEDIVEFTQDMLSKVSPYITIFSSLIYIIGGIYRLIIFLI